MRLESCLNDCDSLTNKKMICLENIMYKLLINYEDSPVLLLTVPVLYLNYAPWPSKSVNSHKNTGYKS